MKYFYMFFCTIIITLNSCLIALSGDFSKREIYGFSADGSLFAFEEYGVQDGSGFPYSSLFIIDTATDQWLEGSPFHVRLEDESKSVFDARAKIRISAGTIMKSFEHYGNIIATHRATELGIDTKHIIANPRLVIPLIENAIEFRLEEIILPASEKCNAFGIVKGFRLLKIGTGDGDKTIKLHEDKSIPETRNCPLQYDFADLVTYYPEGQSPVFAILIRMQTVGFEGPNGRFLAITGRF